MLFKQIRIGYKGIPFTIYKFRTYTKDGSKPTFFGTILRKTKLDELPQLYNLLKGDMVLVGPRPDVLGEAFRLYGVASYGYAVERLSVDDGAVRPDVVGVGRSLLTRALVYYGKSVKNAVAVIVIVLQIESVGHEAQGIRNHTRHTIGIAKQ
jgi:hypothetical protein